MKKRFYRKTLYVKPNHMKYIILSCGLLFLMLSAQAKGDRLYNFYVQHDQDTYYLSAPYGGGDELVTKKLTKKPGDNEAFFLEVVRKGKSSVPVLRYRIRTFHNFYLSLTEDGTLIAEDKEPTNRNLFDFKAEIVSRETIIEGVKTLITSKISLGKRLRDGSMWYLSFDEEEEWMHMQKSGSGPAPHLLAQTLDVTVTYSSNIPGMAQYELKWIKSSPSDKLPVTTAYLKVSVGRSTPKNPKAKAVTQIWKVNSKFEPVINSANLYSITLRTRKETDKAVKLESIQLWKNGKYYKQWELDTTLESGHRIVLFTNGSIKVY